MEKYYYSLYFWEYALHVTYMANTTKPTSIATLANVVPCMSVSPLSIAPAFSLLYEKREGNHNGGIIQKVTN
ncbi:hypothetical protein BAG01nite_38980 [Brevibacillus agri]|jgi:hypothetical protein|uniref:Uncharacterized protein n=1 Tax=Brevibacillus agri TaxID=51101 RepID=A0ABQ0SVE1_9BACL|nr:hypothetical protein PMI08_02268 [Brevibacillus sp. CF112]GED27796.1 hypothetical protein BAG01nite_38980 [Brevibacillus agri]